MSRRYTNVLNVLKIVLLVLAILYVWAARVDLYYQKESVWSSAPAKHHLPIIDVYQILKMFSDVNKNFPLPNVWSVYQDSGWLIINSVQHHVHQQPIGKFKQKMETILASLVDSIVFLALTQIPAISARITSWSSIMGSASLLLLLLHVILDITTIGLFGDALTVQSGV